MKETTLWVEKLRYHAPLLLILLIHLGLAFTYSILVPLGEAPDELAHLNYARFIAKQGRLPATLAERQAAGYRSTWPPLYHLLVAIPLDAVGDTPPTRLKSVGDTPRRLIPTDGQTIAAFIHTADEAWPWRGITLAWHLGRLVSVLLSVLAVAITYVIAWRLSERRTVAMSAAALHAVIPQALFIGSVVNDDNLVLLLAGLILLTLVSYSQRSQPLGIHDAIILGMLLGLATVTKYNALPLWLIAFIWGGWLLRKQTIAQNLARLFGLVVGAILTSGWWFIFVWSNFNQVARLGPILGSLTSLTAGTADASLRQLATGSGSPVAFPALTAWLDWLSTLFQSFWGLFGGGSTIEFPTWIYWLLAVFCLSAIGLHVKWRLAGSKYQRSRLTGHGSSQSRHAATFLFLSILFFLPLPIVRFILSGNIVETAQGRHLFPALPAITLGLVWSLSRFTRQAATRYQDRDTQVTQAKFYILRFTLHRSAFIVFIFILSLYGLALIRTSYPPPIPLRTTADAATVENPVQAELVDEVMLVGYELGTASEGILPITLAWQAESVPREDYLIELTLTTSTGQTIGGWIGQPIGGRYPTRAWDKGDVLRDTVPVPLLPGLPATDTTLTLRLLDTQGQPTFSSVRLKANISLTPTPLTTGSPAQLRADGLAAASPFSYRSTLSFIVPESGAPGELIAPSGQVFPAARRFSNSTGSVVHFIVDANWPSGSYQFENQTSKFEIPILNRSRQFERPSMDHTVNANFGDFLTLLGYDLPQRRVQSGVSFPITLHWRAERTMDQNLTVFNHLLDQEAIQRGGTDRVPLQYYTTLLWVPGEIVTDSYLVPVEATAPPGVYWLDVGLYPSDQPNFSLPLFVDGQAIDRNSVRLGPIKVGGPPPGVTVTEARPQNLLNISFDNQITLLGFNLTDTDGSPIQNSEFGIQNLQLTLFWRAEITPAVAYTVFVHLLDPQGNLVAQFDSPPAAGAYPTSLWDPGEIIVDERYLNNLLSGRYRLLVGLYRPDTGERLPIPGVKDGAVKLMDFQLR